MSQAVEQRRRAKSARQLLFLWAPPLALMGLIFFFSAQSHLDSGLGAIDLIGRKLIHAGEYALLTFLWWRALRTTSATTRTAIIAAVVVAVLYAVSDEYHQSFVEGRTGSPIDVLIDTTGALVAAFLLWRRG